MKKVSLFLLSFLIVSLVLPLYVPEVKAPEVFVFTHVDAEVDLSSGKLSLYRWNREDFFSLNLPFMVSGFETLTEKEGVKFTSFLADLQIYKLPNGIEYEVILKSKPPFLGVAFPIDSSDLAFYYQPPLDGELNVAEYDFVNATHAIKDGMVENYRPINIVGSYAVYHKTKRDNEYKAGKLFHIYRPLLIDALGSTAWATLEISDGSMSITLPQEFLDSAVYPVTVDPTFGYETQGSSLDGLWDLDCLFGSLHTSPADADTADSISVCCKTLSGTYNFKGVIALHSTLNIISNGITDSTTFTNVKQFYTASYSTPPSLSPNTAYVLMAVGDYNGAQLFYDTGDADQGHEDSTNSYASPTNPTDATHNTDKFSIYCTYSAGEGETKNFYGTINQQFSVSSARSTSFTRYSTITSQFTINHLNDYSFSLYSLINPTFTITHLNSYDFSLYSQITQQFSIAELNGFGFNVYGLVNPTFTINHERAWTFNLFGTVTQSFAIESTLETITGTVLDLWGSITQQFSITTKKSAAFTIFGRVESYFAIEGTTDLPIEEEVTPPDQGGAPEFWLMVYFITGYDQVRIGNVTVTIYDRVLDEYVLSVETDSNGLAKTTMKQGDYRYVAEKGLEKVDGTFILLDDDTIYIDFQPKPWYRYLNVPVVLGLSCFVGVSILGVYKVREYALKKEREGKSPRKPKSHKIKRPKRRKG